MLGNFEGWEDLAAAKLDYQLGTHQYRKVQKAAFVGDKKIHKWMVRLIDPFTRQTEERYFDTSQLDQAWGWVKE